MTRHIRWVFVSARGIVRAVVVVLATCSMFGSGGARSQDLSANAALLDTQGGRLFTQGRYAEAEAMFRRQLAIEQQHRTGKDPLLAHALYNVAHTLVTEGRFADAEPLLRQALVIRETGLAANDPAIARTLNELGFVYQNLGRPLDAEGLYRRALAAQRQSARPNDPAMADTLINLGYLDRTLGRFTEAEPLYRDALAIETANHGAQSPEAAQVIDNLGVVFGLTGRVAEAETWLNQALAIRRATLGSQHPKVADSLCDLGNLYRSEHRLAEAEAVLTQCQTIWEATLGPDHPRLATRSLDWLGQTYQAKNDLGAARRASDHAVAILERRLIESEGARAANSERTVFRGVFLDNLALLTAPARLSDDLVGRSFAVAQLASATGAGQAVASMAARVAAGGDALAAAIRVLQDLDDRRQQIDAALLHQVGLPDSQRAPRDEAELRGQLDDTNVRLRAASAEVASAFPAYAGLTSAAPLPLATAQSLLAADEALMVTVTGPEATYLWVVRRDRAAVFRSGLGARQLTDAVMALRARLDPWQNPDLLSFPAIRAHALYQQIFGPAESLLRDAKQVLIVPDGALASLPPGVLVTQTPARDPVSPADYRGIAWFARDHAVTILPSVRALLALRRFAAGSHAPLPFLGIGNPVLGPAPPVERAARPGRGAPLGAPIAPDQLRMLRTADAVMNAVRSLPSLPETADELRRVGRLLGASEADLLLGPRASEATLRQTDLSRYRIIEFATHGLMSGDLGQGEPSLVLTPPSRGIPGEDGLLTASKIALLRLDADWVVMSACNTASGDGTPDAEGLSGLARAFFYAGARSLLVSHWSVNSVATVQLTTTTFAELSRTPGLGRAEALRRAMLAMLEPGRAPELAHPMFWAPFVLAGEGAPGR